MKNNWKLIEQDGARVRELSQKLNSDPCIIKTMMNRGVTDEDEMQKFLSPSLAHIHDWRGLAGIQEAIELLCCAIEAGSRIRIFGDYDIDGVMSTYILHQAIKRAVEEIRRQVKAELGVDFAGGSYGVGSAGVGEYEDEFVDEFSCPVDDLVTYQLPHRIYDGYGLNVEMVDKAYADGVELIITCDNGIAAVDAIRRAKEYDMTVIVTDHHEVKFEMDENGQPVLDEAGNKIEILPDADAIVDPHRAGDEYLFKEICGGMVAWKVMMGLYSTIGIPLSEAMEFIEYAAFATVGDIMPLLDENRAVVKYGLERLQAGRVRNIGLKALINQTGMSDKQINAMHIGFILGPCVNATGRLDSAERGVELLEATDSDTAERIAIELVSLNEQRKAMTEAGTEMAKSLARKPASEGGYADDKVLVIYLPDIHESIAGIIAGRVREAECKPTFILTNAEQEGMAKGSGRSIPAYNMFEHMVQVGDVFSKYGGHPMAAGFSLSVERIDEMRTRLNEMSGLTDEDLYELLEIDGDMPISYITEARIRLLETLEPYGEGNRKPKFMRRVKVVDYKRFGKTEPKTHISLTLAEVDHPQYKIAAKLFNKADEMEVFLNAGTEAVDSGVSVCEYDADGNRIMDVVYYPSINEFNGRSSVEIILQDWG